MINETGREAGESWLADMDEVAETMWRNELTDTVLELLERDGSVTRETLRDEVVTRIADDSRSRLQRATYQGALKALDGKPPS